MRIAAIGEVLWDIFADEERLGGASLNFAVHAARLGHEVRLLSAVGDDERGRHVRERMAGLGLSTRFVPMVPDEPTGIVTVRVDAAGQPDFTLHRPAAYDRVEIGARDLAELAAFDPGWIYYGTLQQMAPQPRAATRRLADFLPSARRFYDVNLRAESYTPELVWDLLRRANVVKLNEDELAVISGFLGFTGSLQDLAREFGWEAACVTRGERGCAVLAAGGYAEVPGYPVRVADTVGAGDAFAAAFLHGLNSGWNPMKIGDFANRLGALVASRPGGVPPWRVEEL